jgi:cobalt-zinc-cadmium efflux system outer membrane protein
MKKMLLAAAMSLAWSLPVWAGPDELQAKQEHNHPAAVDPAPQDQRAVMPTPKGVVDASSKPLGLADLEQMAAEHNPTLRQAAAKIEAAHGRAVQAGLYPNPTVGYSGEEIGNEGRAGEQGAFIDQMIVTAGKLRLSRQKFCLEVRQAEAQAVAQQYRVINGVRMRFFQLLAMQRLLEVREELLRVADDAVRTTEEMANVGQANRPDLLQARIEAREQRVALQNSLARYEAAWQQLAAFLGVPELPLARLDGDLTQGCDIPTREATWSHLREASPEIHFARSEVTRSQIGLRREEVEPIPNVNIRGGTQYNFETNHTQALAQVYLRVPLYDRNQGNIRTARASVSRAVAEIVRVELDLQRRLAKTYAHYKTAKATAELYGSQNLPDAKESYQLYLESFRERRAAWPQVIIALRNYFRISADYVEALAELRRAEVAILGLLLVDGMEEPPGPPSDGGRRVEMRRPQEDPLEQTKDQPLEGMQGRSPDERTGR